MKTASQLAVLLVLTFILPVAAAVVSYCLLHSELVSSLMMIVTVVVATIVYQRVRRRF